MDNTYSMGNLGLPRISWLSDGKDSIEYLDQCCLRESSEWILTGRFLDPCVDIKSYADWLVTANKEVQQKSIFGFSLGRILAKMEFDLDLGKGQDQLTDGQLTWLVVHSGKLIEKKKFLKEVQALKTKKKFLRQHPPSSVFMKRETDMFLGIKNPFQKNIKEEVKKITLKMQKKFCEPDQE